MRENTYKPYKKENKLRKQLKPFMYLNNGQTTEKHKGHT